MEPETDLGDRAAPEEVGLSSDRLARIERMMRSHVDDGQLPGAVALVYRRGRVAYTAQAGVVSSTTGTPIPLDAIFRIYSMTKPVTSVAALSLHEDGLFDLSDPVGRFLPELADLAVGESTPGGEHRLVAVDREITIADLLRHTSGIVGGYYGTPWILREYEKAGIRPFDHTDVAYTTSARDLVAAFGKLPLAMQPGSHWEYGRSGDVLGCLLEVVGGKPLDTLLADRVFTPLGMTDTGFFVPPERAHRIVQPTAAFAADTRLRDLTSRPTFLSGGSGAFSSARDYLRFTRMLLGMGELDGHRVLSRKSVELMTSDQLGPLYGTGPDYMPRAGYTFGLGVAVRRQAGLSDVLGSAGDYWWLGRGSTSFFVDPAEDMIGLFMTQKYWRARVYQRTFKNLVYQAVID
ncbi:serine hydrolase domain-containing protein [Frankia sp. AgB32]|uniref:serine hydrolase domain-containing protein n=1 Tax=Frankia sp. AgB32 TaxID=631119 RepID=UPI0020105010|nr:serine hydrolase domain-containing protein [Frankia sp. AgB32]MCK9896082.1 beta-lactamase family protein [Frankia sp. AgB32]